MLFFSLLIACAAMNAYLLVALGSALGGCGRFALAGWLDGRPQDGFYWGTLLVNVAGCLAMGAIAALSEAEWVRLFVLVGILGGFTTFSAFSLHTLRLVQAERWGAAAGYALASVALCLVAVWLGWTVVRMVTR